MSGENAEGGDEVDGWNRYQAHEQQMSLRVAGEVRDALEAVRFGLSSARFKIKDRRDDGFRATYQNLLALIPDLDIERTTLVVSAAEPAAGQVDIGVRVESGGIHRSGADHAAKGLTAAVQRLREHGVGVSFDEWTPVAKG